MDVLRHPVVIAGGTILVLTWLTNVLTRGEGANPLAAALGNPSGSVPYAVGASAMGPVGGLF